MQKAVSYKYDDQIMIFGLDWEMDGDGTLGEHKKA